MKNLKVRAVLSGIALTVLAACAGAPSQNQPTRAQRSLIATEELDATRYRTAFEVVEALRPQWLRTKGSTSFRAVESVKVYLDDSLLGTPEQLRQITTSSIASIRFMDGPEASGRWGLDHGHGAIVVSTRREAARP